MSEPVERELLRFAKEMADSPNAPPDAARRLGTYLARTHGHYQCPYCWMDNKTQNALTPAGVDGLRCISCQRQYYKPAA
jgi:hypothetical protein